MRALDVDCGVENILTYTFNNGIVLVGHDVNDLFLST